MHFCANCSLSHSYCIKEQKLDPVVREKIIEKYSAPHEWIFDMHEIALFLRLLLIISFFYDLKEFTMHAISLLGSGCIIFCALKFSKMMKFLIVFRGCFLLFHSIVLLIALHCTEQSGGLERVTKQQSYIFSSTTFA